MSDPTAELVVPPLVLVEIEFLYARKRVSVNVAAVQRDLITATNCMVYPLDEQVVSLLPPSLNIHDAVIVATALVYRDILKQSVALVTKDTEIARSGYVQTVW
jgi:predicted nucleic acid-binding protein